MIDKYEHFLFRQYSIAVKKFLQNTFYLKQYPKDENVSVYYSPLSRIWAKILHPVINGGTLSPNVNFVLESYDYTDSDMLGTVRSVRKKNDDVVEMVKAPLIYSLNYKITLFTRKQSEMDVLIYQILTKASKRTPYAVMVDGQWCLIKVESCVDETNLEPGEVQDKVCRTGISLNIPRAYLPMDYTEESAFKSFDITFDDI
jgi:hypothetical protein